MQWLGWGGGGGGGLGAGVSAFLAVKAGRREILSSRPPSPSVDLMLIRKLDGRCGKRSISQWVPLHLRAHITYDTTIHLKSLSFLFCHEMS